MLTATPSFTAALLFVALTSVAAAAEKPPLRSSSPAHLDAPAERHERARVVSSSSAKAHETSVEKVNINTADVKELMTLTGVGRKVAEKIVEYRDNHGAFKKADELRKVDGVGNGLWEKNRDRIVTK